MMLGRCAIITGAAKGLGRAFCESLLNNGAKVVLSDVDLELGLNTSNSMSERFGKDNVRFKQCDVRCEQQMSDLFKYAYSTFGTIDIVVNNAGICHESEWEQMLNVNLTGAIRGTYLGLEYMRKDKGGNGGTIINVASASGLIPTQFVPGYSASKAGLISFSRSLAQNRICRTHGVRINCLCPFFVDTDIIKFNADQVIGTKTAQKALEISGTMPISYAVEGFMELIRREDLNGQVLLVSSTGNRIVPQQFATFEEIVTGSKL